MPPRRRFVHRHTTGSNDGLRMAPVASGVKGKLPRGFRAGRRCVLKVRRCSIGGGGQVGPGP
jgi:hypothetical protein